MNHNATQLAGNLTRDPELRFSPKGTALCKFGIAINRRWKDAEGQAKEETTFVDIDSFGKTAELIGQYFKKGHRIFITGRLKLSTWDDKQTGAKRSKLIVVCESFQFIDRSQEKSDPLPDAPTAGRVTKPAPEPAPSDEDTDKNVPF